MSWPPNKGSPASKQRMSKWVVEAISLAYESTGQPSPMAIPLDQEYGCLEGPDIRSYSPRGLWCGRLVLTAHIRQILFFGPGLYPRFPSALVLVLLVRFTQDRHSSLWWCCTTFPKRKADATEFPERERSVTTVTSVHWRGTNVASPAISPSCL